jgi:hypothetical protein
MIKLIIGAGNFCLFASMFLIIGLSALLLANIVIAIIGVDFHTVLSFWELLAFLFFNTIIFLGLVFSLDYYETLIEKLKDVFPAFSSFLVSCKDFDYFYTVVGSGFYWRVEEVPYLYLPEEIYNAIYTRNS